MVGIISVTSKEMKVDEDPGPEPTDFRSIKMVDYDFEFTPQKIPPTRVSLHTFCSLFASVKKKGGGGKEKKEREENKQT